MQLYRFFDRFGSSRRTVRGSESNGVSRSSGRAKLIGISVGALVALLGVCLVGSSPIAHAAGTVTPTLTLSSSVSPSSAGQSVSFLLTLAGPAGQTTAPSGTVQFAVDGADLGGPVTPVPFDAPPPVSGSTARSPSVSTLSPGTHTITATFAGDSTYAAAAAASITQTVNKTSQSISFTAPATGTVGGSATLTATGGGSGNPVVFSVDPSSGSGVCAVSDSNGSTVSYTAAGSCVIDADQAGNASYAAAPQVTGTITVGKASQSISFTSSPPSPAVFGGSYTPAATGGGSGNPVVFSIDSSSAAGRAL
jgi:Bacterial Ig-like domain (group 3)